MTYLRSFCSSSAAWDNIKDLVKRSKLSEGATTRPAAMAANHNGFQVFLDFDF